MIVGVAPARETMAGIDFVTDRIDALVQHDRMHSGPVDSTLECLREP